MNTPTPEQYVNLHANNYAELREIRRIYVGNCAVDPRPESGWIDALTRFDAALVERNIQLT